MNRIISIVAICLIVLSVVCVTHKRQYVQMNYDGDTFGQLGIVKISSEGGLPVIGKSQVTRLGYPFIGEWSCYPIYEKISLYVTGKLSNRIGIVAAVNLMCVGCLLSAAVSFYLSVKKMFNIDDVWGVCLGVLFACNPYMWFRLPAHLMLSFIWVIPVVLCLVYFQSQSKITYGIVGLILGFGNPYNIYFAVQLIAISIFINEFYYKKSYYPS